MNDQQQSRADALTVLARIVELDDGKNSMANKPHPERSQEWKAYAAELPELLTKARAILAASPVEQPAAAPASTNETGAEGLLRRAREELSLVEWEDDPPNRVIALFDDIEAYVSRSPAMAAAAPADDARECLMDVVSHHDNIVAGFAAQRLAAEEAQDSDTAGYWKREIDVAHRMKAQAERALAAASPAAEAVPDDCDVRKILLNVVPGMDGEGHEVYARNVADVEQLLSEMGERLDAFESTPQPAQADAPVRIEALRKGLFEARDAMRVMSNWVKKSDPGGHSWAVRMVDRANAVLNGEADAAQADAPTVIDVGVDCLTRVRKLMTRFGIAADESIEGFSASIEDHLNRLVQVANAFLDKADAPAEAREPIAWVTDDDRAITAAQKQRALADGGATASSVRPYSIPCYAVSAPADAGEAAAWRYRTSGDNWCYCDGDPVHVCDRDYEKQPLYTAPPAARVASLTNSQREAIEFAAKTMEARMLNAHACVLRALLNGADKS